jgi:hypothetical protein
VVCVENTGYATSLELRKLYAVIPERRAEAYGLVRVMDESGKDYLFPAECFRRMPVPDAVRRLLLAAAA